MTGKQDMNPKSHGDQGGQGNQGNYGSKPSQGGNQGNQGNQGNYGKQGGQGEGSRQRTPETQAPRNPPSNQERNVNPKSSQQQQRPGESKRDVTNESRDTGRKGDAPARGTDGEDDGESTDAE